MGRVRNTGTGVVVTVRDGKETSLGLGWEQVNDSDGEKAKPKGSPGRRSSKKSE